MSKRRVHELARELGLDNREAVVALQAAGVAVKTHSSSVYEEEAMSVLKKVATPPPPAAPAGSRRPGMMIVKKRQVEAEGEAAAVAHTVAASQAPEPASPPPVAAAAAAPSDDEPVATPPPRDEAVAAAASAEPTTAEAPGPQDAVAGPPAAEPPPAEVGPVPGIAAEAAGDAAAPDPARRPAGAPGSATVVRMIDRDKLLERVPGRRLGGGRPEMRRGPGGAPAGPSGPRFGQVTELRVVTDPFGRGREMVQVGRDKKKGPAAVGAGAPRNQGPAGRRGRMGARREMSDLRERAMHPSRLKKKKSGKRMVAKAQSTQPRASKRVIKMKETIVVADLAHQLGIKATDIIRKLMGLGTMVAQNQSVDLDTAQLIAADYEFTVESVAFSEAAHLEAQEAPAETADDAPLRPPVVTVMGHVDHGKTSLLDAIRKSRVARGEAGGITQHIGAYQVKVGNKGSVTFLDTPGHAAFTAMRARGAQATDIVVLVVAADDGLMPQTEEAIRHAQAAKVPIVVAINKIDKPEAQPDRVLQELSKFNLVSEAWGGDTLMVQTSATRGDGIKEILETILLQAEVLELRSDPKAPAVGTVIEAQLDRGRGPVATILVRQGTLRRGDAVVVGGAFGKVRALIDDQGRQLKEAGPSAAVEITGLDQVPAAGDTLNVAQSAEAAREVAQHRQARERLSIGRGAAPASPTSLDDLMRRVQGGAVLELKLVLKADVQGSVEAVREALAKLSIDEVRVNIIYGGVGAIKESDITLAAASGGMVLGFGVRPDSNARQVADREGVEVRTYSIIYEAIDDMRRAMEGLLTPESKETIVGRAEVRDLFRVSKVGTIAGCRVVEGKAQRAARLRILRDSVQIYEGRISSLKRFKDDAREVDNGLECGIGVEGYNDLKVGDVIEFFQLEEVARTLERASGAKRPVAVGQTAPAHP